MAIESSTVSPGFVVVATKQGVSPFNSGLLPTLDEALKVHDSISADTKHIEYIDNEGHNWRINAQRLT